MGIDRTMVNDLSSILDSFEGKARVEFDYLNKYGFNNPDIEKGNTWVTLKYQNTEVELRINFSILDQFIDIKILKIVKENIVAQINDYDNVVSLSGLIIYNELSLKNVDKLYVYHGLFEEALESSAILLKKYGTRIFEGFEWISERQVQQRYGKK